MSIAKRLAIALFAFASPMSAHAAEPACRDIEAAAGFVMPAGQLGAAVTGPSQEVPAPTHHLAIPEGALDSVTISLDRTICYGSCPSYSVELRGDGTASYNGKSFVLIDGRHTFNIPKRDMQCLLDQFRKADFWSLADKYIAEISDGTTARVTLNIGGQSKTVVDYFGRMVGMPRDVVALEDEIDRIAADRWVKGTSDTLADLKIENFDFHSQAAAQILAAAASTGPDDLVFGLTNAGAPVTAQIEARRRRVIPAVVNASSAGRLAIVQALVAKGAFSDGAPPDIKERALLGAARSGNPQVVAEILKVRPNVNAKGYEGMTPLIGMWDAKRFAPDKSKIDIVGVTRLLLDAGADPNIANDAGSTALFSASNADAVRLLLKAGAKLGVRNKYGSTPLLFAKSDEVAVALIEAGADVTATDRFGETVEKDATEHHWSKTLAILRERNGRKRR